MTPVPAELIHSARMKGGLTRRQRELLLFIEAYIIREGVAPTFEEMRLGMGFASKQPVYRLLECLQERGCIQRLPFRARAIILTTPTTSPPPLVTIRLSASGQYINCTKSGDVSVTFERLDV